jgi:hypothetical protein
VPMAEDATGAVRYRRRRQAWATGTARRLRHGDGLSYHSPEFVPDEPPRAPATRASTICSAGAFPGNGRTEQPCDQVPDRRFSIGVRAKAASQPRHRQGVAPGRPDRSSRSGLRIRRLAARDMQLRAGLPRAPGRRSAAVWSRRRRYGRVVRQCSASRTRRRGAGSRCNAGRL